MWPIRISSSLPEKNKMKWPQSQCADFSDLQINSFMTSDGVMLTYWKAGRGQAAGCYARLVGERCSVHGAQYIKMYCHTRHLRSDQILRKSHNLTSSPHAVFCSKSAPLRVSDLFTFAHFPKISRACVSGKPGRRGDWWPGQASQIRRPAVRPFGQPRATETPESCPMGKLFSNDDQRQVREERFAVCS